MRQIAKFSLPTYLPESYEPFVRLVIKLKHPHEVNQSFNRF